KNVSILICLSIPFAKQKGLPLYLTERKPCPWLTMWHKIPVYTLPLPAGLFFPFPKRQLFWHIAAIQKVSFIPLPQPAVNRHIHGQITSQAANDIGNGFRQKHTCHTEIRHPWQQQCQRDHNDHFPEKGEKDSMVALSQTHK